jgi:hypothetical protein
MEKATRYGYRGSRQIRRRGGLPRHVLWLALLIALAVAALGAAWTRPAEAETGSISHLPPSQIPQENRP